MIYPYDINLIILHQVNCQCAETLNVNDSRELVALAVQAVPQCAVATFLPALGTKPAYLSLPASLLLWCLLIGAP